MVKIRKYANGIERFLHGEKGQRFFNFAYSIGAAIVIWGALFKILHLPGGSTLLCIGMGTEIAMFILTAFDRPPKEYAWEEVFPALDTHNPEDRPDFSGGGGVTVVGGAGGARSVDSDYPQEEYAGEGGAVQAPAAVYQAAGLPAGIALSEEDTESLRDSIQKMSAASEQLSQMAELTGATQQYLEQMAGIAEQMTRLQETTRQLNEVSEVLLGSYKSITDNSERISGSSSGYVDRMEDLNRNISGLNTIYEIQLKGVSSQLDSIDRVNRGLKDIRDMYEKSARESSRYCEETEKMARYMKQLNQVYEKMITAMTINMYNPMMGGAAPADNPFAGQADAARQASGSEA
ncbi:MAG: gliding motility protein GldL [Muribaculaceae bacterium]|nr:gliding motility protein GldL [Muribaculaceae bacterium]